MRTRGSRVASVERFDVLELSIAYPLRCKDFGRRLHAPGRIRTCDPRIRSPPSCLRKRRLNRLVKPKSPHPARILLPEDSHPCVALVDTPNW